LAGSETPLSVGNEFGEFADKETDFVDESSSGLLGARVQDGGRGDGDFGS
jgi:hypothetical protein